MHKIRILGSLVVLQTVSLAFGSLSYAEVPVHRQHGTHEHGVAQLNIAQEGNRLQLELSSPAMNIVGFEHAPRNDQERQAVAQALATLRQATQLFVLTPAANCKPIDVEVETSLMPAEHDHHEEHADFDAAYVFECQQISALTSMEVTLFRKFPATEDVDVKLLTGKGQTALELNAKQSRIDF